MRRDIIPNSSSIFVLIIEKNDCFIYKLTMANTLIDNQSGLNPLKYAHKLNTPKIINNTPIYLAL